MRIGRALEYLKETYAEWSNDDAERLAAALSFYVTLSIAPFLFVVIAIAGLAFDRAEVRARILLELQRLLGEDGAETVRGMLENVRADELNGPAAVIGLIMLVLGASGVFLHLQGSLNTVWGLRPKPGGGIFANARRRLLSMASLVATGFMLLVTLVFGAALSAGSDTVTRFLPQWDQVIAATYPIVSLALTTGLFAMIFKYLPDARVPWRDVWVGAAVTAVMFALGQLLIGLYLGRSDFGSTYGAAGSFVIVLFWVYYASQILFLGAEFTQVWARRHGRPIEPNHNAVSLWTIDSKTGQAVKALPKKLEGSPQAEQSRKQIARETEPQPEPES